MSLTTVFQLSIYALAAFSSAMLAKAEGAAIPAGLSLPLVAAAFFFNERWRALRLSTTWANVLGIGALVAAIWELMGDNIEARLLSGAHLLVYLFWIVLFQEKSPRHYWWMCALGVLQVAVGAVLTNEGTYGVLLVLYVFLAIWTLSVFSLYQARVRFAPEAGDAPQRAADRPVAATTPRFSFQRSSHVRHAIQLDPQERWISLRFACGTAGTAVAAMLIGLVFFLLIPRVWIGPQLFARDVPTEALRALTGFTEEVQLGDIGQILESTEPVLDLRLYDDATGEPLDVYEYAAALGYDEPLFRGAVLDVYDSGRWSAGNLGRRVNPLSRTTSVPSVRQELRMQPIGTEILMAMHPVVAGRFEETSQQAIRDVRTNVLTIPRRMSRNETRRYTMHSPRTRDDLPPDRRRWSPLERGMQQLALADSRQFPADRLAGLAAEARRVSGYASPQEHPPETEMSQRLVAYLRDSGQFTYSLDASVQDRTIDVVEDFLLVRKQGHCEYFASALALMLRSVDVPARLISGFKGGKVNSITGDFEVEQRHAHAWVEAYIDGKWVVLDATPAAPRNESVASMAPNLPGWGDLVALVREFWSRYVVNMNINQQQNEFYEPAGNWFKDRWESMRDGRTQAASVAASIRDFLRSPRRWFSWQGGVFTFVLLVLLSGMVWFARRLWQWWSALRGRLDDRRARSRRQVAFYERFQRICAARGMARAPAQTPLEFADEIHGSLNALLTAAGLSAFPRELIGRFYGLRFGEETLDDESERAINQRLTELELCLAAPEGHSAGVARP